MVELTIRCHPSGPIAVDELQSWLDRLVHELLARAPQPVVRLSRLHQDPLTSTEAPGWLLELQLEGDEQLLDSVVDAIRDMALLGLRPSVLVPLDSPEPRPDVRTPRELGANRVRHLKERSR